MQEKCRINGPSTDLVGNSRGRVAAIGDIADQEWSLSAGRFACEGLLVSGLPGRIKGNGRPWRELRGLAEHDRAPEDPDPRPKYLEVLHTLLLQCDSDPRFTTG